MLKNYKINKFLIFSCFVFLVISLITISSASTYLSPTLGNLPLKQGMWYLFGFVIILIIMKLDNNIFYKYAWYIYLFNVVLLLGLLFFAPDINGSKCWYVIKGIGSFQPSEFMKISLMLILSKTVNSFHEQIKNPTLMDELKLLLKVFILLLIPSVLTFLEPDTGAVIIYVIITFLILLIAGIRPFWFVLLGLIILLLGSAFLYTYFLEQDLFISIFGNSFFYRMDRIVNWKGGSGMQLENALAAIGSSNLWGYGYNKTPIYFPESGTDFIFAVFASNFGLIGSLGFLLFLILFNIKIINIGLNTVNKIDKYLVAGISGILIYQQVQNIGMTLGLLPITGITLPFISYGGSSLLSYMILIGLLLNGYNYKDKKRTKHQLY